MTYSLEREEHRWESETHATPHCSLANEMARAASIIFPPRVTGHQLALLKGVKAPQRRISIGLEDAPPRLSLAHGKQSKGRETEKRTARSSRPEKKHFPWFHTPLWDSIRVANSSVSVIFQSGGGGYVYSSRSDHPHDLFKLHCKFLFFKLRVCLVHFAFCVFQRNL